MRKAQKFQPNIKDVSEVTAKLQKGGHSDLIPVFLGQNATLTKGGRVSTKKGVNDSFDPSRTAYRKGFSIDDFINELVGLGTSGAQAALFPVDQALQANIEKHKAKEEKPKFKPKDDRKHIADRLRKNAENVLNSQFLAADPETKAQMVEAMRDAGLKVSYENGKVYIPKNLSTDELRRIEDEQIVPKPKEFKRIYNVNAGEFFNNLKDKYYSVFPTKKEGKSTAMYSDIAWSGKGKNFEKAMEDIGRKIRNNSFSDAMEEMLEFRDKWSDEFGGEKTPTSDIERVKRGDLYEDIVLG